MNRRPRAHAGVRYGQAPEVVYLEPSRFLRRERLRIPVELTVLAMLLGATFRGTARLLGFAARHWRITTLVVAALWIWATYGTHALVVTSLAVTSAASFAAFAWSYRAPDAFAWHITSRARGTWRRLVTYDRRWREVMHGCGLLHVRDDAEYGPQIKWVRSWPGRDILHVRLAVGQTPDQLTSRCEALAHAFGVFRVDARATTPGWVRLTVIRRDPLTSPVTVCHPVYARALATAHSSAAKAPEAVTALLDGVPVGVTETSEPYRLPVRGGHVLVAGCTNSGKSGLEWALLRGLAPVIRAGYVSVTALDPKWMELAGARDLVEVVTDVPTMPTVLEQLVAEMDVRCRALEGTTRLHVPSRQAPHRIVLVDELATLTALADRKSRERVEIALGSLTSRGRAAGFTVVLTTVEPTKEVVRWRGLHAVRVGFRMEEASHTDMTLGDGARDRGALCDQIDTRTPGVGYVKIDGDPTPVRVRIVHVTDDDITAFMTAPPVDTQDDADGFVTVPTDWTTDTDDTTGGAR